MDTSVVDVAATPLRKESRKRLRRVGPEEVIGGRRMTRVKKGNRYFYVLPSGEEAFNPRFKYIGRFVDIGGGRRAARVCELYHWWHIDETGSRLYKSGGAFEWALDFQRVGDELYLAPVKGAKTDSNRRKGAFHLTISGKGQYPARYDSVGYFELRGEKMLALATEGPHTFYIDLQGRRQ